MFTRGSQGVRRANTLFVVTNNLQASGYNAANKKNRRINLNQLGLEKTNNPQISIRKY